MQVLRRGRKGEWINSEGPLFNTHRKIRALEKPSQIFVAASQIKDVGERLVLLQMHEKEIQKETLAAAGRPKNGRVRDVLIMQVKEIGRPVIGFQDRQVFRP